MGAFLSGIVFLQPWILSALLTLPLLWFLLRVTPPSPRMVYFPAARFLSGLVSDEQTPNRTPWWILLLRLLIAALIIIALARPVYNPAEQISGAGPVRIVFDNSWAGAQTWSLQMEAAEEILKQASRERREIYILGTAPLPGEEAPFHAGPLAYQEAAALVRGMKTRPWGADYQAAKNVIVENKPNSTVTSIWLASGLDEGNINVLVRALQAQGSLIYTRPQAYQLPLLLREAQYKKNTSLDEQVSAVRIAVDAPSDIPDVLPVSVKAISQNNQLMDIQSVALSQDHLPLNVGFDIPQTLRGDIGQFRLSGRKGAGSVFLLDSQFRKRQIGIAAPAEDADGAPLVKASYFIKRAMEPFSIITIDTIDELLKNDDLTTIILPDVGAMPSETLNALEGWVHNGGLLIRFAGPNLSEAQGEQYLLPVQLRAGERSLAGSMSWEDPQSIAPFDEDSPFFGLDVSGEIKVRNQVLADPAQDLEGKVWGRLTDGTPIITGMAMERGLVVLIHTTATPDWSELALSGLYVNILKRLANMSGNVAKNLSVNHSYLDPVLVLDGSGALVPPTSSVEPISANDIQSVVPNSVHPPGIYGAGGYQVALNLGTNLPALNGAGNLPSGVMQKYYDAEYELDMMPYLLYIAVMLFMIDWIIMIVIMSGIFAFSGISKGLIGSKAKASVAGLLLIFCVLFSIPAGAQDGENPNIANDIKYASGFYLAYVRTGDLTLDSTTEAGLENLSQTLTRRTSIEPDGVVGVDPETSNLAFFPLLYWAISHDMKPVSGKAMQSIQNYLDHGGTILFDTRDQSISGSSFAETSNGKTLRMMTKSLSIPPLTPIPEDHVLSKAFYLLDEFPGRFSGGTFWVEQNSVSGRDGVSSVLIGSHDWAASWASSGRKQGGSSSSRFGGTRQQELALRFGVNLVMYALTGNYKNDQVHLPHILKRLDR